MASRNPKLSVAVSPNAKKQIQAFQNKHKLTSLSSAVVTILEEYFKQTRREELPSTEESRENTAVIDTLTKRLDELAARLVVVEEQLQKFDSIETKTSDSSLQEESKSTQPHDATYGSGEAGELYLGWEVPANISYVFERFYTLNTDEARAAFADKWVNLSAQSIDTALVICYQLLSLIKEQEMYKLPQWMEENKTYDSFQDYFEDRCRPHFQQWSELELTHQLAVENCRPVLEALLPQPEVEVIRNGSSELISASKTKAKKSPVEHQLETIPTSKETNNKSKKAKTATNKISRKEEPKQTEPAKTPPQGKEKLMTTAEVSQFSGLTAAQINRAKQPGALPLEVSVDGEVYSIDYAKKGERGKNLWSVKPLQEPEPSQPSKSQPESNSTDSQASESDISTLELTQTDISNRLNVPRSTFRRKKNEMSNSEFAEWTRSNDPDGIAWTYSRELKKYRPVK
ncbi:MAG: hypothetical protein WA919_20610 [Coleofasciculaceae cyanobacterium]